MTIATKTDPEIDEEIYGSLKEFVANRPQARAYIIMPNEMYCFVGRGGGKTQGIIAPYILHKVEHMPRSNGGLIVKTFTDGETKILQPLLQAFQMLGLEKDIDYRYGKQPPESWEKPLTPIIDWQHVLSFPNGTTMELISLHLKGSANGKSIQWIVCDEAKFMDEVQLRGEVFPILRGHVEQFGGSAWYGAKLFVTDKLSPNMDWLLDKRKLVDKETEEAVIRLQLKVNDLRLSLADASESRANKIKVEINKIEAYLTLLRKDLVCVIEASAMDNIANLSPSYFHNMKRSLTAYEYKVAIDNEDPTRVENNFYPDRNEHHLHNIANDDDYNKPIGVVLDYQASLSPLVSFQINDLILGYDTLNFLDAIYVKHPLGLKEVVNKFCDMHINRPCKEVIYFYDHTATGRQNEALSFDARIVKYFEDNKWKISRVYMGKAPEKDIQYDNIKGIFQNVLPKPYQVMINHEGCSIMVMSMDRTETKVGSNGRTTKNKHNETVLNYPQEYATHFSDCFDQAVEAVIIRDLYPRFSGLMKGLNGFRKRN